MDDGLGILYVVVYVSMIIVMLFLFYDSIRTSYNLRLKRQAIEVATEYVIYMLMEKNVFVDLEHTLNLNHKIYNLLFWAESYFDYIHPSYHEAISLFEQLPTKF